MTSLVSLDVADHVATITMTAPPVNALSRGLIRELDAALTEARPPRARVAILRAEPGSRVWSAGHDVRELPRAGRDPLTYDDPIRGLVRHIEHWPAPIVALVEGSVWGGACELAFTCDLIVAAEGTTFALTPARLGVPYDLAGTMNLLKVVDMHVIKELLFTARPMAAARLAGYGIVNRVVPPGELEATTRALTDDIVGLSPHVLHIMKEQLRSLAGAHPLPPESFERIQALRRAAYDSPDYQEGIDAFLEKRPPDFSGE